MLVGLAVFGWIVMNHRIDALDVQTTSGNIGSNQCHALAVNKGRHGPVPLAL